jgi:hypothetical protein
MNHFRDRSLDAMAERIILTATAMGISDERAAQEIFSGLPSDHYLLRDYWARRALMDRVKDERSGIEAEKYRQLL